MYLVDTSIWIDYFRNRDNSSLKFFIKVLENAVPFGITSEIYQEILQGSKTKNDFKTLTKFLSKQRFFSPKDKVRTYQSAAELYFLGRSSGITIRSTIDCLIAQIAIEHNLILLHNDKDFVLLNKISPKLKLAF